MTLARFLKKKIPRILNSKTECMGVCMGSWLGGPSNFFVCQILAKKDFFGSMKDVGYFGGYKKGTKGFLWVC